MVRNDNITSKTSTWFKADSNVTQYMGNKRPSSATLKDVDVRFCATCWTSHLAGWKWLKAITSCDFSKEIFITKLIHCLPREELENICREFTRELTQWIARLQNFPLTNKCYNKEVREATSQEIEHRENTIEVAIPLTDFSKNPTVQNIHRLLIMLRQLWSIRFIDKDDERSVKRKLKSTCVKLQNIKQQRQFI